MTCLRGIILLLACLVPMGAWADSDREPTLPDCREAAADPTIKLYQGGPSVKFALACYFSTTGSGMYTAAVMNTGIVKATVHVNMQGDSLEIAPAMPNGTLGATSVTVTRGSESKVFYVEVLANCVAVADPIPMDTLLMDGTNETVDVAPHFLRDRGRALEFSATSSALVDVTVSGSTLTLDPGPSDGTATVTVTAKNNCGMMASDFDVLVETPVVKVKKALPDTTVARNDTLYIHLADHFRDPDGETIAYYLYWGLGDDDYVGASIIGQDRDSLRIIGKQVHPTGNTSGMNLSVEAADPDGYVIDDMSIVVTLRTNGSPEVKQAIADRTLASGGYTAEYTLSDHFEDPDGDVLTYSLPSPPSIATGRISGGTLTVTTGSTTGTAAFTVRAEDPDGAYVEEFFDVTVTQNRPPTVDVPIGDRTVASGGSPIEIRLGNHFSDPDGDDDALSYTVERLSQSGVVTATIADNETERSTLTVTPEAVANRSTVDVTIRASDPGGLYAESTFTVTVSVECVITVHAPIADTTLASNGYTAEYLLAEHFSASPHCTSALTYTAESDRPDVATVAIADNGMPGSKLTVTSRGTTQTAEITVTATSDAVSEPDDFEVEVTENEAPELIPIADVELELGGNPHPIPLANHFTDPDGKPEDVTYTWSSSNASLLTIGRSGGALMLTPGTATGSTTITLRATDPGDLYVEDDFTVTVSCGIALDAPMADVSLISGGNTHKIDLTDHFSSTCPSINYTPTSSHTSVATVTESSDELTVTSGSSTGTATIMVEATATGAASVSGDFEVRVTDACETTTTAIGDFSLPSDGHKVTIDLANHFSSNCTLQFVASSDDNAKATVSESSGELTVTSNDAGQATITVRATEPGGTYVETEFDVDVDENEAPEVERAIPDQQLESGGSPVDFELDYHFEDPDWDDDLLHYSVHSPNPGVASARIRYNETPDSELIVTPGTVSQETDVEISVTARDPGGLAVTERFDVTVGCTITLDAPIGDVTLSGAGTTHQIPLSSHFSSNHCPTIGYTADSDDPNVATVSESGGTLTVTTVGAGTAEISVTASATGAASVTEEFDVTVTIVVDDPPEVTTPIPDQTLKAGGSPKTINLDDHFTDEDTNLNYSQVISNVVATPPARAQDVVTASINNTTNVLTLTPGSTAGSATVTVTATDSKNQPTPDDFTVTVNANAPPNLHTDFDARSLDTDASDDITLSDHFEDPDGNDDQLRYTASSNRPGVATASIANNGTANSELTVTATGGGLATISVTATDPEGAETTERFTATVNYEPVCSATHEVPLTIRSDDATRSMSSFCSDADRDNLTYSVAALGPNPPATVTVSPSGAVRIVPRAVGTVTATVTADDGNGGRATQLIEVTVSNLPPETEDTLEKIDLLPTEPDKDYDLDDYFSDPENESLTYRASSDPTGVVSTTASGSTLTLSNYVVGETTVEATAEDPHGASEEQEFTVRVCGKPTASAIPDYTFVRGDAAETEDLEDHFSNPNSGTFTYGVTADPLSVLGLSIDANNVLTVSPGNTARSTSGPTTVEVTVTGTSDCRNQEAETSFTVTLRSPPFVTNAIGTQSLQVNGNAQTLDLSQYFNETDGDTVIYTARLVTTLQRIPDYVSLDVTGSILTMTPGTTAGSISVEVTATDPDGSASQTFTLNVTGGS